jgi:tight adherence protein B
MGSTESCSTPSASGTAELLDQTLVTAVGLSALLGCALVSRLRAERRRSRLEQCLKAITTATEPVDCPVFSLRRPPQRAALPMALARRLEPVLAATGDRIRPLHLFVTGIGSVIAVGLMAVLAQLRPFLAVALSATALVGAPVLLLQLLQGRYRQQFVAIFPEALDLIVRGVRAGLPVPEAMEMVSHEIQPPVGAEFRRMLDEIHIGTEVDEALQHAAERIRLPDFHFFVVSLLLQRQTGGGIAETLANLSAIIRQRKAVRLKARALTAEAQASAAIVAATPFVAGIGLFLINRELMSVLFTDPRGRFMLDLAVVSLVSGIVTMRALIKRSLR